MVGEALSNFKGEEKSRDSEVRIELPLDAYLPHEYVPSERLRLDMYKRLAEADSYEQIEQVRAELSDRFGTLPFQAETLLKVAQLRIDVIAAGLLEVINTGPSIRFAPVDLKDSVQLRISRLYPKAVIKPATRTVLIPRGLNADKSELSDDELLDWVRAVLAALAPSVPLATDRS